MNPCAEAPDGKPHDYQIKVDRKVRSKSGFHWVRPVRFVLMDGSRHVYEIDDAYFLVGQQHTAIATLIARVERSRLAPGSS